MAVEKLLPAKFAKIKLRQDARQNDFLGFPGRLLSPKFRLFWGQWTFSTPPDFNNHRYNHSMRGRNSLGCLPSKRNSQHTMFHHIHLTIQAKDKDHRRAEFSKFGLELPAGKKVPRGEVVTFEMSDDDPRWEKMKDKSAALERQGLAIEKRLLWPWEDEVKRLRQLASPSNKSEIEQLESLEGYSGQSVDQLLSCEGKYGTDSLIMAFEQAISLKAEREGLQSLTDEERVVLAVEALEREVNNGGYDQFFVNSSRDFASIIVGALRRIGCKKTEIITQRAIKAIGISDLSSDKIGTAMAADNEQRSEKLTRCDDSYYKSAEPVAERLFGFIKANRAAIRF